MTSLTFLHQNARWLSVGGMMMFLSSFGQTFFISIFAGEIRSEFGLSHGGWGSLYAIGTLASAVVMVWAGMLSDRLRVRVLGPCVLIGLALACLLMAGNHAVWAVPVVIFLLRFFGQGMASHVAQVAMARWFARARGKALAVATMGFSVGEALLPMIVVAALGWMHWRGVWVAGALVLLLLIPVLMWLLKEERTPQSLATQESSTGMGGRHWRRTDMLRHPLFWMLLPYLMMPPCFGTAFYFQQVHMAEVRGWTHAEFVALVPLYTVTGLVAMMSYGWAIDRFGSLRLLPLFQLPFALGFWVLSSVDSAQGLALVFVLFALMTGGAATVFGAFWAEFYGTGHLGAIKSLGSAVMVLASALGPGISGTLIDAGYDFPSQAPAIALAILCASALAGFGVWRTQKQESSRSEEQPLS